MTSIAHYAAVVEECCELIDAETGDLKPDVLARFEQSSLALSDKVDNWIGFLEAVKSRIELLKARAAEARRAAQVGENLERRLKDYLKHTLQQHPDIPFKGTAGSLKLQKNPPALKLDFQVSEVTTHNVLLNQNEDDIPLELRPFLRIETLLVLDKVALKAHLQAGKTCSLARIEQDQHVRVRP